MKALLCIIFSMFCLCIPNWAKKKPKALILFNNFPITKENALNNSNSFHIEKRIYYILMSKKPLKCDKIRVKIYKRDASAKRFITQLVYCNDYRLNTDNIYYFTDYIVMHTPGEYNMAIFTSTRLDKPIATADFQVNE